MNNLILVNLGLFLPSLHILELLVPNKLSNSPLKKIIWELESVKEWEAGGAPVLVPSVASLPKRSQQLGLRLEAGTSDKPPISPTWMAGIELLETSVMLPRCVSRNLYWKWRWDFIPDMLLRDVNLPDSGS